MSGSGDSGLQPPIPAVDVHEEFERCSSVLSIKLQQAKLAIPGKSPEIIAVATGVARFADENVVYGDGQVRG